MHERFWASVQMRDGCWNWTGRQDRYGYGRYGDRNAHRALYQIVIGDVPEGLQLDHLCGNRQCVRPDHLEPVTQKENLRRGWSWQREKRSCLRGHKYTAANTYHTPKGRSCRECARAATRAWRASR